MDAGAAADAAVAGVAGSAPGLVTATPAALAAAAAPVAAPAGAPASLFRSLIFLDSSATRSEAALAWRSLAIWSSAAGLPCTAPLDRVSLSGVAVVGARSSTLACTLPPACRLALPTWVVGTPSASFRRNSLKSLACATTVREASPAEMAPASSAPGRSSTAPDLSRLILPPMNASGLLLSKATSIWSSETLAGLFWAAIFPAVSPCFTATCWPLAGAFGAGLALAGGAALATGAGRMADGARSAGGGE